MLIQAALFGIPSITYCQRCGRGLRNPTSIQRGIGPICYGKQQKDSDMNINDLTDRHLDIDLNDGIYLQRDEHGVATNVPHTVIQHSPSGYEFGYGGSGPADLALNLAETMLHRLDWSGERVGCYDGNCFKLAWDMHQQLKWQFIASAPHEGIVIPYATIKAWIEARIPTN
jgi:hypothetical protein